jgi:hypothetical protein
VAGSAWSRLRAWLLHAPAERLPLPLILTAWPSAWVLHAAHVPGHVVTYAAAGGVAVTWLTWRRHARTSPHSRLAATEAAMVTAMIGGWIAAAVTSGPLGWPAHLLSWLYLAGAVFGYRWLRRHEAVRAARARRDEHAAWTARKAEWHRIAHLIGLGDFHLQSVTKTHLGEELLLTSAPGSERATQIAAAGQSYAEKYAHLRGLPYGRVDVRLTDWPGQLVIEVRTADLSSRDAAYHPMTAPWPDAEPSPFADWFPETASIRDPVIWGFCPEDGSPLTFQPFSEMGGRAVGFIGMTGSGKSNLLNGAREHNTRCDDGRLVQLNGAHMGDELIWEPLSALTICGPVRTDEDVRARMAAALDALCLLVTNRSATLAETGHSTFQPDKDHPAVEVVIDEVDEIVAHVPGAGKALEFLASKQRKSAVCLLLATQRAVVAALGGGAVRANMSEVLVGKVARASESRHATGGEKEIPDIREYARGAPGYFQQWDPHSGEVTGRGRAFLLGKPPDELAYMRRIVAARRHLRDWSIPDMPPLAPDAGQDAGSPVPQAAGSLRDRLAIVKAQHEERPHPGGAPLGAALPAVPGVPAEITAGLVRVLAAGALPASAAGHEPAGRRPGARPGSRDRLRRGQQAGPAPRRRVPLRRRVPRSSQPSRGRRPGPAPGRGEAPGDASRRDGRRAGRPRRRVRDAGQGPVRRLPRRQGSRHPGRAPAHHAVRGRRRDPRPARGAAPGRARPSTAGPRGPRRGLPVDLCVYPQGRQAARLRPVDRRRRPGRAAPVTELLRAEADRAP